MTDSEWWTHEHHHDTPEWAREALNKIFRCLADIKELIESFVLLPQRAAVLFLDSEGEEVADISVSNDVSLVNAAVAFADAKGDATSPTGSVSWASSDDTIATVDGSADPTGLTAVVNLTGATGSVAITATDGGSGVSGSGNVTVTAGPPATAEVSFSQ